MLDKIVLALIIIGGINWGSIGIFGLDLVGSLFGGQGAVVSRLIFSLVGLAALWSLSFFFKHDSMVSPQH